MVKCPLCGRYMSKYVSNDNVSSPQEILDWYECLNPAHLKFSKPILAYYRRRPGNKTGNKTCK